jgi:hypothetical protein
MEREDIITLSYEVSSKGKEKLISVYFNDIQRFGNGRRGKGPRQLSKLDKVLLEKRPLNANLSLGMFELKEDSVKNIYNGHVGEHNITYKRID